MAVAPGTRASAARRAASGRSTIPPGSTKTTSAAAAALSCLVPTPAAASSAASGAWKGEASRRASSGARASASPGPTLAVAPEADLPADDFQTRAAGDERR